jgi:hypothetical protein
VRVRRVPRRRQGARHQHRRSDAREHDARDEHQAPARRQPEQDREHAGDDRDHHEERACVAGLEVRDVRRVGEDSLADRLDERAVVLELQARGQDVLGDVGRQRIAYGRGDLCGARAA